MAPNDLVPIARAVEAAETRAAGRLDATALQPNIGALMHDVARLMRRRFERRARQTGLSITRQQARALLSVARNEGLVERRLHPTDRRVRTLWLTPLGWTVVDRILAINAQIREEACAGLNPAARETLLQTLDHLKSNLLLGEESETAAAE